jgi:hypothetical protein
MVVLMLVSVAEATVKFNEFEADREAEGRVKFAEAEMEALGTAVSTNTEGTTTVALIEISGEAEMDAAKGVDRATVLFAHGGETLVTAVPRMIKVGAVALILISGAEMVATGTAAVALILTETSFDGAGMPLPTDSNVPAGTVSFNDTEDGVGRIVPTESGSTVALMDMTGTTEAEGAGMLEMVALMESTISETEAAARAVETLAKGADNGVGMMIAGTERVGVVELIKPDRGVGIVVSTEGRTGAATVALIDASGTEADGRVDSTGDTVALIEMATSEPEADGAESVGRTGTDTSGVERAGALTSGIEMLASGVADSGIRIISTVLMGSAGVTMLALASAVPTASADKLTDGSTSPADGVTTDGSGTPTIRMLDTETSGVGSLMTGAEIDKISTETSGKLGAEAEISGTLGVEMEASATSAEATETPGLDGADADTSGTTGAGMLETSGEASLLKAAMLMDSPAEILWPIDSDTAALIVEIGDSDGRITLTLAVADAAPAAEMETETSNCGTSSLDTGAATDAAERPGTLLDNGGDGTTTEIGTLDNVDRVEGDTELEDWRVSEEELGREIPGMGTVTTTAEGARAGMVTTMGEGTSGGMLTTTFEGRRVEEVRVDEVVLGLNGLRILGSPGSPGST